MERALAPRGFGSLMSFMVRDILLVASAYDSFILEEDGRFSDRMLEQYVELELSSPPHFQHVTSSRKALDAMRKRRFDLVLCTPHCVGMPPDRLAARIKELYKGTPVVLITQDRAQALRYLNSKLSRDMEQVFLWNGDPKLLVALVKSIEDRRNAQHDAKALGVRVILMVEDDPAFYSAFLPELYNEMLIQCHALVHDRLNERDRRFRMRARPKILLANDYEEAVGLLRRFKNNLLGVFCDMRFPRKGRLMPRAGQALIKKLRKELPELPILLTSWEGEHRVLADELEVQFANKADETLSDQVSDFMKRNFGFGSFEFRLADGTLVDKAETLTEMVEVLKRVPGESLAFHADHNHFSNWLMARSEFRLAAGIQPRKASEFDGNEGVRAFLVEELSRHFDKRQEGQVTDFPTRTSLLSRDFIRIGQGSMGGKARGSAFLSYLLANTSLRRSVENVRLLVPRSAVICADYFDSFVQQDDLRNRAMDAECDEEVAALFLEQPLADGLMEALHEVVRQIHYPLAVRSSSLLEDVSIQPLAGLYDTYMLPNNDPDLGVRLDQLSRTIRLVMASAFFKEARRHLRAHNFRPEREKMAVMVQRVVGRRYEHYFYPDFAGVAQSHNYYPMRFLKPEDGIAVVALGMGHTVVEGRKALRFSPAHPKILPQMSTVRDALSSSQRDFYALDLYDRKAAEGRDTGLSLKCLKLEDALRHGTLDAVGATYSHVNNTIYDTVHREGAKIVNFAGVLKFDRFPLASVLQKVLAECEDSMGAPVELEFAVTLGEGDAPAEMALLELRPLSGVGHEDVNLEPALRKGDPLCRGTALGNGITTGIYDIVYMHPSRLKLSHSRKLALEIERFNHRLTKVKRPYLLIGPGRWGSSDPWMGIPVVWSQVSGASAIVELELVNSNIEPSLGAHFFHNLSTLRVGYFCLKARDGKHDLDLDWLEGLPVQRESLGIRHVTLQDPVNIYIDGRQGKGVILKQGTA